MKILSINLWFDNYGSKTLAQLSAFQHFCYQTYIATIVKKRNKLVTEFYYFENRQRNLIDSHDFPIVFLPRAYQKAFKYIFSYAIQEKFNLIYIRRLMSKSFWVFPYIKKTVKKIPIVYEIPTFPYDKPLNFFWWLKDFIELTLYKHYDRYITLTVTMLSADVQLRKNWIRVENGIDIDNYILSDIPTLEKDVQFLIIANVAKWHHYERMLFSMKSYQGQYNLHLIMVAPESGEYNMLKKTVSDLAINHMVTFYNKLSISEICKIASKCHIGVGQLSSESPKGNEVRSSLKNKDYCAMGLPFFSSIKDDAFAKDFPYFYHVKIKNNIFDIDDIIRWYKSIYITKEYKMNMYQYAKKYLQFFPLVNIIENEIPTLKQQRLQEFDHEKMLYNHPNI